MGGGRRVPAAEESMVMSTTLSASPSPSMSEQGAELTAAFVAGFRSATTRSDCTANRRDWFAWTEATAIEPTGVEPTGIEPTGIEPCQVQRRVVEAYVGRLEEAGYAPNTICQRLATLSSFYRWAVAEDHLPRNPVDGARSPASPPNRPRRGCRGTRSPTGSTPRRPAAAARTPARACSRSGGLRVGELCAADIGDLSESTWHPRPPAATTAPTTSSDRHATYANAQYLAGGN